MSKASKKLAAKINAEITAGMPATLAEIVQPTAAVQPKVELFTIGKLPRNGLNEGTKHGDGGTAGTYKAVCAALAGKAGMTIAEIQGVCKANNDPGFARYAVRNHWLLPVEVK
jgi:hypothetical protein